MLPALRRLRNLAATCAEVVICAFLLLVFLALAPLYALGLLVKSCATLYLRATGQHEDLSLLLGADALFCLPAVDSRDSPCLVSCAVVVDGHIDVEKVVRRLERLFALVDSDPGGEMDEGRRSTFARLRCYVVRKMGYYMWRRDREFDVRRHFGTVTGPQGKQLTYCNEAELQDILNHAWNIPFEPNHPQWRMDVFRNKRPSGKNVNNANGQMPEPAFKDESILTFRWHHSLGDGMSVCGVFMPALFEYCLYQEPARRIPEATEGAILTKRPHQHALDRSESQDATIDVPEVHCSRRHHNGFPTCAEVADKTAGDASLDDEEDLKRRTREWNKLKAAQLTLLQKVVLYTTGFVTLPYAIWRMRIRKDENPLTDRPLTGKKLFYWLPPIPQDIVKRARHLLGGITINDIAATAVSRAIWRYMVNECSPRPSVTAADPVCSDLKQVSRDYDRRWVLSHVSMVSCWEEFPDTFRNKFGICRLFNQHSSSFGAGYEAASVGHQQQQQQHQQGGRDGKFPKPMRDALVGDLVATRDEIQTYLKKLNLGFTCYLLVSGVANVFPASVANWLLRAPEHVTYSASNVRGSPVRMKFLGKYLVTKLYAFPPQVGTTGLSVMTFGYYKELFLSLNVDTGYIPEGHLPTLGKYWIEEISLLQEVLKDLEAANDHLA